MTAPARTIEERQRAAPRTPRALDPAVQATIWTDMAVCRVAYTNEHRERAHVSVTLGPGDPAAELTACGRLVLIAGDLLPHAVGVWADQDAPWCSQCLAEVTFESVGDGSAGGWEG